MTHRTQGHSQKNHVGAGNRLSYIMCVAIYHTQLNGQFQIFPSPTTAHHLFHLASIGAPLCGALLLGLGLAAWSRSETGLRLRSTPDATLRARRTALLLGLSTIKSLSTALPPSVAPSTYP